MACARLPEASQVQATVAIGMEARSAIVAALDYMERDARQI
jgi:hypothetical protein